MIVYGLENLDAGAVRGCVLCIGNFDGVHRGHQRILAEACAWPGRGGGRPVVVLTFDPHPLEVVAPSRAPARLMTLERRVEELSAAGANVVVVARSEPELLGLQPEEFVEKVIAAMFAPVHIVEGPSFGFGRGRRGDVGLLRALGAEFGYTVSVVPALELYIDDRPVVVSSSLVRECVARGEVCTAGRCLGRPYEISGVVEHGAARGQGLGFPTANLGGIAELIPAEAVYAGSAGVGGRRYTAAISIGRSPTFGGDRLQVEAFLLDGGGDLYGQSLRLDFWQRLRPQERFATPQLLAEQIARDVEQIRTLAARYPADMIRAT